MDRDEPGLGDALGSTLSASGASSGYSGAKLLSSSSVTRTTSSASGIAPTPPSVQWLALTDVARARWRQDEERTTGLWFYDPSGRILNHLDSIFLADQAEARSFLGWARRRVDVPFPVEWPPG